MQFCTVCRPSVLHRPVAPLVLPAHYSDQAPRIPAMAVPMFCRLNDLLIVFAVSIPRYAPFRFGRVAAYDAMGRTRIRGAALEQSSWEP
jgi:hypothetical protein